MREQPEYLAKLPKDRHGLYIMLAVVAVLILTLVGAWKLYIGTVAGWQKRFEQKPERPQQMIIGHRVATPPSDADLAEFKLRQLAEARARAHAGASYDRCIDGIAFRKLPDGGWENIPKTTCVPTTTQK